jgi:hypothetical protein
VFNAIIRKRAKLDHAVQQAELRMKMKVNKLRHERKTNPFPRQNSLPRIK